MLDDEPRWARGLSKDVRKSWSSLGACSAAEGGRSLDVGLEVITMGRVSVDCPEQIGFRWPR